MRALESTAKTHTGHVFTVGHAYKLLDAGYYFNPQTPAASTLTLNAGQSARYVLRAAVSFAVVPAPWQLASVRRDPLVTCLLLGFALPTAAVLALTNGNVGTLLRLRGLVTPYLVWVSAVGLCAWLATLARHRTGVVS